MLVVVLPQMPYGAIRWPAESDSRTRCGSRRFFPRRDLAALLAPSRWHFSTYRRQHNVRCSRRAL